MSMFVQGKFTVSMISAAQVVDRIAIVWIQSNGRFKGRSHAERQTKPADRPRVLRLHALGPPQPVLRLAAPGQKQPKPGGRFKAVEVPVRRAARPSKGSGSKPTTEERHSAVGQDVPPLPLGSRTQLARAVSLQGAAGPGFGREARHSLKAECGPWDPGPGAAAASRLTLPHLAAPERKGVCFRFGGVGNNGKN